MTIMKQGQLKIENLVKDSPLNWASISLKYNPYNIDLRYQFTS